MQRKGRHNSTAFKIPISILQHGNAPIDRRCTVFEITLFQHSDKRSPNYYCLYKHPITGKMLHFSCRSSDPHEAARYASMKLPEVMASAYQKAYQPRVKSQPQSGTTPSPIPSEPVTLLLYGDSYVSTHRTAQGRRLKPKSGKAILDTFNQFNKFVVKRIERATGRALPPSESPYLHMITADDCFQFISSGKCSARSAQKHYVTLRAAFDTAVRQGLIQSNYFDDFSPPTPAYTDEQIEERCFSEEDFGKLYKALPTRTHADRRLRNIIMLLHETGLRLGELRHIKLTWIDLQNGVLRVKSDRDFSPKTTASSRSIPLSNDAIAAIQSQIEDNQTHPSQSVGKSGFLFCNQNGAPLSEAGIEAPFSKHRNKILGSTTQRLHGLRHSLVTRLSLAGASDRMIQDVTGQSPKTIARYSHMKERLVEPIREILNGSLWSDNENE